MDPEKSKNSDTSSIAESEKQNEGNTAAATGCGRSYDCNFCKRGFTNAQALGGHMNIHRKDKAKAKAKKKNQEDLLIQNFKSYENYKNLSFSPQISSTDCNLVFGGQVNYQVYLPSSNLNIQTGNNYQYDCFPVWRPDHLKDHMDGNLSLRIGPRPPAEDEAEVDLELRLGRYP